MGAGDPLPLSSTNPDGLALVAGNSVRGMWRGARAAESDSLLTSDERDSGTNRRTRKSSARHDSTGADSGGPENIGPVLGPGPKMSRTCASD
jgi:hypothetical protein